MAENAPEAVIRSAGSQRVSLSRFADERGSGLVGTIGGLAMFAVLLMFAVNLLTHLYYTSTVTAVTFDAARTVAGAESMTDGSARASAATTARALLGGVGEDTRFDWSGSTADAVRLRVDAPTPHLLPSSVLRRLGIDRIRRTVVVRAERFRTVP
jgi:hypothetical protein